MIKLILAVGARPNFMKLAPLYSLLENDRYFHPLIVHTGQHYDYEMSKTFFKDLKLPEPHYYLGVGSGTHATQTANVMVAFEKVLEVEKPELVAVFGDVNSTLACSLTAKKCHVPVAHIEAGLRSFDEAMPEEINRKLTDAISDFLFTHSRDGDINLKNEGIDRKRIYRVGNIMIDSLITVVNGIDKKQGERIMQNFRLMRRGYGLITLHRPCNVDGKEELSGIMDLLNSISQKVAIIFPMHPRTRKSMDDFGISLPEHGQFQITDPLSYREFIMLEKNAIFALTDSGGVQEETTFFHVPCLTLRINTERPVTIEQGTNELVDITNAGRMVDLILAGKWKTGTDPELWDGKTAERIVEVLKKG